MRRIVAFAALMMGVVACAPTESDTSPTTADSVTTTADAVATTAIEVTTTLAADAVPSILAGAWRGSFPEPNVDGVCPTLRDKSYTIAFCGIQGGGGTVLVVGEHHHLRQFDGGVSGWGGCAPVGGRG